MSRLQQRRRLYRRRRESINKLRAAVWLLSVAVLFCFPLLLSATGAYFTDRAETHATFRATTFGDNLALAPGNSKTNNSPGNPGPAFSVAQTVGGQIYLDFGTYPAGNNRNFPAVLVVRNTGERPLTLNWHFSGSLAPFFESQDQEIILAPGSAVDLGFKLDTRPSDQPGEYFGTLYLSALDGFIAAELPARLRLAADQGNSGNNQGATVQAVVYEEPETTVSEAVYQAPGTNHTNQDSSGSGGSPAVSESVDMGQSDVGSESAGQQSNGLDGGEPGSAGGNDGGGSDGNSTDSSN